MGLKSYEPEEFTLEDKISLLKSQGWVFDESRSLFTHPKVDWEIPMEIVIRLPKKAILAFEYLKGGSGHGGT